jgi:DNA-directed RNA polymerase specialized sigma24 family protein
MTDPSVTAEGVSGSTSLSLLERAKPQDPQAWTRLFDLYAPRILCWCRLGTLGDHAAEEVCQKVFQRVFAKLKDIRRDAAGQSFRAWLRAITENCACDYWRRNPCSSFDGDCYHFAPRYGAAPRPEPGSQSNHSRLGPFFPGGPRGCSRVPY